MSINSLFETKNYSGKIPVDDVIDLLHKGACVDECKREGNGTALFHAVRMYDTGLVLSLLAYGADPNSTLHWSLTTPTHLAAANMLDMKGRGKAAATAATIFKILLQHQGRFEKDVYTKTVRRLIQFPWDRVNFVQDNKDEINAIIAQKEK